MPEGVDSKLCDVIGKDVVRILHRDPAKLWVEVIERPILRLKSDKNALSPRIYQAKAVRHAHKDTNSCHKDSEVPNPSNYSSEIQEGRSFRAYLLSSYPKFNPSKPRNKRQKRPGGWHGAVGRAPAPQAAKFIWCSDTPSTSTRYAFLLLFCFILKPCLLHETTIKIDKTVNRYLIC